MKKIETLFSVLLIPLDFILLIVAGLSAYHLRFSDWWSNWRPVIFDLPFNEYWYSLLFVAALWLIIFAMTGLYNIRSARKIAQEVNKIFLACASGLALIAIIIFFRRDLFDSRFIVLTGTIFAFFYLSLAHAFMRWLQRRLYRY